jgi:hypothetical protein
MPPEVAATLGEIFTCPPSLPKNPPYSPAYDSGNDHRFGPYRRFCAAFPWAASSYSLLSVPLGANARK